MSERPPGCSPEALASLVVALLSADRSGSEPPPIARDRLAAVLAEAIEAAQAAWPAVVLPSKAFVTFLAERLPSESDVLESLASLRTRELYLTCACSRGDGAALAAFESTYLGPIGRELGRVGFSRAVTEDAVQVVRHRLFVGEARRLPRIVDYGGRGDLARWARAAAVRAALRIVEKSREAVLVHDGVLDVIASSNQDLELDFLKRTYGQAFENAARDAFDHMTARDRNLLRYYFVRGLTIDELGVLYRIHRATAARQVKKANAVLVERTRQCLASALGIPSSDVSSILRLIQSQIELALGGILAGQET